MVAKQYSVEIDLLQIITGMKWIINLLYMRNKIKFLLIGAAMLIYASLFGINIKDEGIRYTSSWIGNTYGGAKGQWMQNMIIHFEVALDGTCYTWSHWDEGGKRFGVYKDGKVVGNKEKEGINSLKTTDRKGREWEIEVAYLDKKYGGFGEFEFVPIRIMCNGQSVRLPGLNMPTALSMDADGLLMVADSWTGPRQQILFYDVDDLEHPKLKREFGDYGGISSGIPGEVTPTKFYGIRGIGMDAERNIYVAISEQGSIIRKFSPNGELLWELRDDMFCDLLSVDPTSDGKTIFGIQEEYQIDYSKPAGQEAKMISYSLDRKQYPEDPRGLIFIKQQGEHGLTSPQIVYLQGKRFMFVGGMFGSNFINIYRYEGRLAIPSGIVQQRPQMYYRTDEVWPLNRPIDQTYIWRDMNGDGQYQRDEYAPNTPIVKDGPFYVDKRGDIWMGNGLYKYEFQGLDKHGNPIYDSEHVRQMPLPLGMKNCNRANYDSDRDILMASEYGTDEKGELSLRHLGKIFIVKDYLKNVGITKPIIFSSEGGLQSGTLTMEGDYVFSSGWKNRLRIFVNRISDGAFIGVMEPGPEVGGASPTGWIDILTGITAFKRSNGEYIVLAEENFKGKVMLYRFFPEGVYAKGLLLTVGPDDVGLAYSKGWQKGELGLRTSTMKRGTVSFKFSGNMLNLCGNQIPNGGSAVIYVDGKKVGNCSFNGNSQKEKWILFSAKNLEDGEHIVKVVTKGTCPFEGFQYVEQYE